MVVQDADSGLASLVLTDSFNIDVVFPAFPFGSKDPVTVVGTRASGTDTFHFSFRATDVDGNETICDPVVAALLREGGSPTAQTWSGLPDFESRITIINPASGGVNSVSLDVDGTSYRMSDLADGEQRAIDVAASMLPGDVNTISATVTGPPGSTATIMITN